MKISVIFPTIGRDSIGQSITSVREADEIIPMFNGYQVVDKINKAYRLSTGDVIVIWGDRCVMKPGWRKRIEETVNPGVISFFPNCLISGAITRDFIEKHLGNTIAQPDYTHYFWDQELSDIAHRENKYNELSDMYYMFPKEDPSLSMEWYEHDKAIYESRKAKSFPYENIS